MNSKGQSVVGVPKDGLSAAPEIACHYSHRHRRGREDHERSWEIKEKRSDTTGKERERKRTSSELVNLFQLHTRELGKGITGHDS
jgi:hypothetical protein